MSDEKTYEDIIKKDYSGNSEESFELLKLAQDFYVETMRITYYLSRPAKYLYGKSLEDASRLVFENANRIKKNRDIKKRYEYAIEVDVQLQNYYLVINSLTEKAYFKNVNTDLAKKMRLELSKINGGYLKFLERKFGSK